MRTLVFRFDDQYKVNNNLLIEPHTHAYLGWYDVFVYDAVGEKVCRILLMADTFAEYVARYVKTKIAPQ